MATVKGSFPARTDDTGTGRDGTPVDVAFIDAIGDAIDAETLSATNPTVTSAQIQDEVVAARGSEVDLNTRISAEHNADGTHNIPAGTFATVTQLLGGIGGVNLVQNDDFLLWPDGDAAAPDGYVLAGAGATVARTGTGLGDTSRKIGDFACKLTRAAANVTLTRAILPAAAFTRADFLKGRYAAGGAWVKCSTPNAARVAVYDGVGYEYSAYHTGGGTWEWLPATRLINGAATVLDLVAYVDNAAVAAIFSGETLVIIDGDLDLPHELSCPVIKGTMHFAVAGTLTATANLGRFLPDRSGIVKDVQLQVKTAPTGSAIDVDVNTNTNVPASTVYPTMASMFTATHPTIAASDFMGGRQPDGTYARRCLRGPTSGATVVGAGGLLTIDIDAVGGGAAGADLGVEIRVLQYQSPLERFLSQ